MTRQNNYSMQRQVSKVDHELSQSCEDINTNLSNKTDIVEFLDLKHQVEILESQRIEEQPLLTKQQRKINKM